MEVEHLTPLEACRDNPRSGFQLVGAVPFGAKKRAAGGSRFGRFRRFRVQGSPWSLLKSTFGI